MRDQTLTGFAEIFGGAPAVLAFAPGRVNLIGEHTDYNGGYVFPMALTQGTWIAAAPRTDRRISIHSARYGAMAAFAVDSPARTADSPWADYAAGAVAMLRQAGYAVGGAVLYVDGDVPEGCGLSSSASFEMAHVAAFEALNGFTVPGPEAARIGQRIENDYLGLRTGVMDQFVSRMAKAGHALFLDCRTLDYQHVPAAIPGAVFMVADSGVSRGLTASKYNERVEECEEAVAALRGAGLKSIATLRDVRLDALNDGRAAMSETAYRRARHVVTENARTVEAKTALSAGDAERFGALMNASHDSLRLDYEVTGEALDALVDGARELPGCFGARMTGAGFGGCTINLVTEEEAERFTEALRDVYARRCGKSARIFRAAPGGGSFAESV